MALGLSAGEPRHLPWRRARELTGYLARGFFDGVLNGNAEALARLAPERLREIDDLAYQAKWRKECVRSAVPLCSAAKEG